MQKTEIILGCPTYIFHILAYMAEAQFVRVTHAGEGHFVALYAGLNPQELCRLLQAAFRIPLYVVGLVDRDSHPDHGIVVPISLACKAPQLLGERTYSLLLGEREVSWEKAQAPPTASTRSHDWSWRGSGVSANAGRGSGMVAQAGVNGLVDGGGEEHEQQREEEEEEEEDDKEEEDEDIVNIDSTVKIVAFVRRMAGDGMIDEECENALENAAVAGDAVVHAAFAVAVRSQDLDYLAALLKDIAANKRDDPKGLRLLEAKREMLDTAEVLHQAEEVDDEQLAFLQNLILVSNGGVTAAFQAYEKTHDPARLAESLRTLCGADAKGKEVVVATASGGGTFSAEQDVTKASLLKVAVSLAKQGLLGALEARILQEMVSQQNPVLVAAFKVYREDGNMAELQDTVARAARIEAKRAMGAMGASPSGRVVSSPGEEISRVFSPVTFPRTSLIPQAKVPTVGVEKLVAEGCASSISEAKAGGVSHPGGSGGEGIEKGASSKEFCRILGLCVRKGVVDIGDARVLYAAFGSRAGKGGSSYAGLPDLPGLVHAAWEVFESSRDEEEMVQSLEKIASLATKPFKPSPSDRSTESLPTFSPNGGAKDAPGTSPELAAVNLSATELHARTEAAVKGIATQAANLLLHTKMVSLEEASCLASPSAAGRRAILDALKNFEGDSSRTKLLDRLAVIAKAEKTKRQGRNQPPVLSQPWTSRDGGTSGQEAEARAEQNQGGEEISGEEEEEENQGQEEEKEEISEEGALIELMELAVCMAEDKRIGAEETRRLTSYIERRHPCVLAAYKDHVDNQDVDALVAALVSIVRPVPDAPSATGSHHTAEAIEDRADDNPGGSKSGSAEYVVAQQQQARERVVLLMHETQVLNASDATRLLMLLARQDSRTLEAFRAFESSKNVSTLVETVNIILIEAPAVSAADLALLEGEEDPAQSSPPLVERLSKPAAGFRSSQARGDAGAGADESRDADTDDGGHEVAKMVVNIVEGMRLDEREAEALRVAISCGDANVKGALELFKLDSDARELKDTLARVARYALECKKDTPVEVSREGEAQAQDDAAQNSEDLARSNQRKNGRTADDLTVEGKEGVFQAMLHQLCSMGAITEAQAGVIMGRYLEKDAVVLAALDVYENQNDMFELVDTLKRLT